jgi:dihydroxyacetone kinase-like protein
LIQRAGTLEGVPHRSVHMHLTREHVVLWLKSLAAVMAENKAFLTELDSAIGDADHGVNMDRGFAKVLEKLPSFEDKDVGAILKETGMTLLSSVGGASGPLYGTFFMKAGMALAGKRELGAEDLLVLFETGTSGIVARGRPEAGDKTMYDVWLPVVEAMRARTEEGGDLAACLDACVEAAAAGVAATIPLKARKGRASYLGERSIGHQDPGATSSWLILKALREAFGS